MDNHCTDHILFGVAYYDEYMPYDRIEKDMRMMKGADISVIRIGESTWSTLERQPGVFDFTAIDRMLQAAKEHDLSVVVGTPTYAVPAWLTALYPDILAETHRGPGKYGARQIMNIDNAAYRFHAERAIRQLVSHVADHPNVIGYQVDNESKYYDVTSNSVQLKFVKYLRRKFNDDLGAMNLAYGLDYWSNRIDAWEDFPDVSRTINGSIGGEFDRFRRGLVTEFLAWQADIVRQYAKADQFITHNFDFSWRGVSHGVQTQVDHFRAAEAVDVAGVDIYHHTEKRLTGKEIGFGGDFTRSLKNGQNYLVLETEAQGQNGWLPFPGQLLLQGISHLASGANAVMYWHWHSIHNSFETYWRGLLSHDFEPNRTYEEARVLGSELARVGSRLVNLGKKNQVAIMVSNESLTALKWFSIETGFPVSDLHSDGAEDYLAYNDVVRWIYDALFDLNIEVDFVPDTVPAERLSDYKMVITPALYCTDQSTVDALREYVEGGGFLLSTFRSFVADQNVKVWDDRQPHALTDVFGIYYNQFTRPQEVEVEFQGNLARLNDGRTEAQHFIELIQPADETEVLANYSYWAWEDYAAITRNRFGAGTAQWIATFLEPSKLRRILVDAADVAGVDRIEGMPDGLAVRGGTNDHGATITYFLNYNDADTEFLSPVDGTVISANPSSAVDKTVAIGESVTIPRWGYLVVEGQRPGS